MNWNSMDEEFIILQGEEIVKSCCLLAEGLN